MAGVVEPDADAEVPVVSSGERVQSKLGNQQIDPLDIAKLLSLRYSDLKTLKRSCSSSGLMLFDTAWF